MDCILSIIEYICDIYIVASLWVLLDISLAVSDHVMLHFGGNSGIHSIGVSICDEECEIDLSSKLKLTIVFR